MSDLPRQLRIKSGMMNMGERIAWGSDTALMEQAADLIEQLQQRNNELAATVERLRGVCASQREHLKGTIATLRRQLNKHEDLLCQHQDLNHVKREAFREGFMASGEGFNGQIYEGGYESIVKGFETALNRKYPIGDE